MARASSKTMLAFGDAHIPHHSVRAVEVFCLAAERIRPDLKRYYRGGTIQVDESCRLETFSGIKVKLDYRGPEPYQPGAADYETDDEMEAAFARFNERIRFGNMDVKYRALQRDGHRCRGCGASVTGLTSHVDHIVPVKRFASFALASTDDNLQTLCLDCHWEKHHAE